MDTDNSSENNSSTESSTESSDDDEKLETAQVCGVRIKLPQGLCERKDVFDEFFSVHTWNSLSEIERQHLKSFLPSFPENDEQEKNITLHRLFQGEEFRFKSNPLERFHENLKAGYFRPDIAKMRLMIRRAERKEEKYRYRKCREKLRNEVIASRQKLLNMARNLPPGFEPKHQNNNPSYVNPASYRTKKRYFQELAAIRAKVEENGFSSDENYPEGPCTPLPRKQRRHLNNIKNSNPLGNEEIYMSTLSLKTNGLDLERHINPNINPFFITEDSYKNLLKTHSKMRIECKDSLEYDMKGITISNVISRTQLPYIKKVSPVVNTPTHTTPKHHLDTKIVQRKRIKRDTQHLSYSPELISKSNPFFGHSSNSELDSDSDSFLDSFSASSSIRNRFKKLNSHKNSVRTSKVSVKPEPVINSPSVSTQEDKVLNDSFKAVNSVTPFGKITPATLSDLDGIDMMNLPIDLEDSNIDILEINNRPELMQETHANFLSLVRDIICSTNEHRMNMKSLEERLKSWQENPISPLNDWYSYIDNWISVLPSAINFLSGNFQDQPEDFVPYIEFKPQLDMYQWIGAGRDSDSLLLPLFQYWLEHRGEIKPTLSLKDKEENVEISDRSQTPPPPRCPTNWTVRKADPEEIRIFQEQERKRYDAPHKAFTYRCNGYESIVGPVKGIYSNQNLGVTKARGHSMLTADRPNFVTILTLVRDAAARLPNGEGTRAEICQLLKSSQYIQSNVPENVLQSVVSGALDRMHTQFDPCVKYDPKRKVWIYLHRNRSEEDFERIHQQYQGISRNPKKILSKTKTTPNKIKVKSEKAKTRSTPEIIEEEAVPETKSVPNDSQPKLQNSISTTSVKPERKVPTSASSKTIPPKTGGTSILITNKMPQKQDKISEKQLDEIAGQVILSPRASPSKQVIRSVQDRKEINETIQAIIQQRVSSPVTKQITNPRTGKSLVKIISPNPGKSLIIPSSGSQLMKQTEQRQTPTKEIGQTQIVSQRLLQTLTAHQKSIPVQKHTSVIAEPKVVERLAKVSNVQGEVLQTFTSQQLQNVKNITVLRNAAQGQQFSTSAGTQIQSLDVNEPSLISPGSDNAPVISISSSPDSDSQERQSPSTKVQTLTLAQQHQILQTLKQKAVPMQQTVLCSPRQNVSKQRSSGQGLLKQTSAGTSLLTQNKTTGTEAAQNKPIISTTQAPLVAKVLTNAAGQVISVEGLLTQKQLSQGAALRIASPKGGQPNIIQLTGASPQNSVAQFAVASSNNMATFSNQLKLVISTPTVTAVTSTITVSKAVTKAGARTHTAPRFSPKVSQQLVNTKLMTPNISGQRNVQQKVVIGQQNQIKIPVNTKNVVVSKPVGVNTSSVRMVSTSNLNLAQLGGKPIILANKGNSGQTIPVSNVLLHTQASANTAALILTNTTKSVANTSVSPSLNVNVPSQQSAQVILSPQLKVQPSQQVVLGSGNKSVSIAQSQAVSQNPIVLGQTVRLQSNPTSSAQRLVLASQNQGGQIVAQQILLPVGFQGTALNIKTLQGVKVVPIAQTAQGRGVQGRQVLARVVNPGNLVQMNQQPSTSDIANTTAE